MSAKYTVCLVSDDADLRKSLTAAFRSVGLTLVGVANTMDYLAGLAEQQAHACLVIDTTDGVNGLDLIRELAKRRIAIPVVVVVPSGSVAAGVQAMKVGAFDVAERTGDAPAEIVKRAIAGFATMQKLLDEKQSASECVASLTRREVQVLNLMVHGKPNRKIAEALGISPKTLDIHRANLMEKMGARTTADLCRTHLLDRIDAVHLPHIG